MSSTRLLLLGILLAEPKHGYEVRRELEAWQVEEWANIAYGSIYFGLAKMAEEGLVEVVGSEARGGRRPARTVYAITAAGRQEFERQLRDFWWRYKPSSDPFQVALAFMDRLPRDELLAALRARATRLRAWLEELPYATRAKLEAAGTPRHVAAMMELAAAHDEVELRWIEAAIGRVERGELP